MSTTFNTLLQHYRKISFSERDKGDRFERLIQGFLLTDPTYAQKFKSVWLWNEFPNKADFGGKDTGIDIVAQTVENEFWAIQCKCYAEDATIDKKSVDSFLSTSSREFKDDHGNPTVFSHRLWVSTTNNWGSNAEEAIRNQNPPLSRLSLTDLQEAPVDWEKLEKGITGDLARTTKKSLREHQEIAVTNTHEHFKTADRGKLIMACGTGKTFTSLRIAEKETDGNGLVLFLVPSIALLGQTLREWSGDAMDLIHPICICSDAGITKTRGKNEDNDLTSVVDLALPASTNVENIVKQFQAAKANDRKGMTVVFSTYQSIEVIAKAQKRLLETEADFGVFDLIICDEAHRTTGTALTVEDSSAFIKVHDNDFLTAKKRLYMTATPRLFSDDSKSKAAESDAVLCSMDDEGLYGTEIYRIGFGEAVERNLLADYKVLILTLSENDISAHVQKMITAGGEISTDDASRLVGCINALSKEVLGDEGFIKNSDPDPMRRAVAFCSTIKASKHITNSFNVASEVYSEELNYIRKGNMQLVDAKHIDGAMTAPQRDQLMSWLKDPSADSNECRILTNVRCLSEGVDVPSLDAVLFLSPRNSQVDVVQSVGRVMRKAPGKKYGYIIIPIVVPADVEPEHALDDNERYKVVWSVLNALRAHDDRFNSTINKINFNKKKPENISVVGVRAPGSESESGAGDVNETQATYERLNRQMSLQFEALQSVVYAKMVQKVGDRVYWEQWAKDVAVIAERQIERINRLIRNNTKHEKAFANFLKGLQQNINPSITQEQAVEMLSQHIITKPVFEALFEGYSFVKNNAISTAMQSMLDLLEDEAVEQDTETLDKFYESVKTRAAGIDNAEGRQRIIIELYDKFFKTAFPKMVEQLGIVYTPVEVVDFIIHSVNDVLKQEFGIGVTDENVHILDPFTGTGTFITRLLQSGLIEEKDLERKYKYELHANEIVLLAYYIAAINIENAYHDATPDPNDGIGKAVYHPFEGMCLTDTFQLGEIEDSVLFSEMFPQNSERLEAQKKGPIRVIMGNPPYSVGQKSANDDAANQTYEHLDARIAKTYAARSIATNKNSLYDSYIKAFRWSTDRLDKVNGGMIAFVSNGAWLDGNSQDGFRKTLEAEFDTIYVFNLRGNQRTSGELSRKEGGKIFGSGSRTPISIALLVTNPAKANEKAKIHYHDIGDYLSQKEKLEIIQKFGSVSSKEMIWKILKPNDSGDWINQRNEVFDTFIDIIPNKKYDAKSQSFFILNSNGMQSNRDAWVYSFSEKQLRKNVVKHIDFYNEEVNRLRIEREKNSALSADKFKNNEATRISWSSSLVSQLDRLNKIVYNPNRIVSAGYRPFTSYKMYIGDKMIHRRGQVESFLSTGGLNKFICVGAGNNFSLLISNRVVDSNFSGYLQALPLYYYEKREKVQGDLFDASEGDSEYIRRDGVSDYILERAQKQYGAKNITKEAIFYYVYGVLHNEQYREEFANDLKKMLPRIPLVDDVKDFWAFSKAGEQLADLHINYESVPPYPGLEVTGADSGFFKVEKMRFPKKNEKDRILYNSKITISNIPEEAYNYVVNGKSAIEWVMERYQVKTDKASGIKNDPNDWADEVGNPRYILDLVLSIVNVSMQTNTIVKGLPRMEFE